MKMKVNCVSFATICILLIISLKDSLAQNLVPIPRNKLLICQPDLDLGTNEYIRKSGVKKIAIIYQGYIDPNNNLSLNIGSLKREIERLFPNKSSAGMCVLDCEGTAYKNLQVKNSKLDNFQKALRFYIQMINFCKEVRPNVKWGIYGVPFSEYFKRSSDWITKNQNILPLLKRIDFLTPSLYQHYPNSTNRTSNENYLKENIDFFLKLGSEVNKPVYPFVWNRWWLINNKDVHMHRIPASEFKSQINTILHRKNGDAEVAGIVWWGQDTYFYSHKTLPVKELRQKKESFHLNYSNQIKSYLNYLLR